MPKHFRSLGTLFKSFKKSKIPIVCNVYKFHSSYFVNFVIFVNCLQDRFSEHVHEVFCNDLCETNCENLIPGTVVARHVGLRHSS